MGSLTIHNPTRVFVDPNSVAPSDPTLSVVLRKNSSALPHVDEVVQVVVDDSDGPDLIGKGVVRRVDDARGLLFVEVDWGSLVSEVIIRSGIASGGTSIRPFYEGVRRDQHLAWGRRSSGSLNPAWTITKVNAA